MFFNSYVLCSVGSVFIFSQFEEGLLCLSLSPPLNDSTTAVVDPLPSPFTSCTSPFLALPRSHGDLKALLLLILSLVAPDAVVHRCESPDLPDSLELSNPAFLLGHYALPPAPEDTSHSFELRMACLADIIPSSFSHQIFQVMHLHFTYSNMLAMWISWACIYDPSDGKFIAFVRLLTAVCRSPPSFTINIGNIKIVPLPLWQIGWIICIVPCFSVNLVAFSNMEIVKLPQCPLVLSGIVAGRLMSKITNSLWFAMFKGSAIRYPVTSAFIADYLIVILAQDAVVSISSLGLLIVSYSSQGDIPFLSTIGGDCRGPFPIFSELNIVFVFIYVIYAFHLAMLADVFWANLALLYLLLNICSFNGE